MLKQFLERRTEKRRLFRALLTDALTRKLAEADELTVDRALLREFAATRQELLRAASGLAIREKLQIMTGDDGLVRICSNFRFEQLIRAAAGIPEPEAESEALILEETLVDEAVPVLAEADGSVLASFETLAPDDVEEPVPVIVSGDIEWMSEFVVGNGREAGGGNLPDNRQTLPPRERDPWPVFDAADLPPFDSGKKNNFA